MYSCCFHAPEFRRLANGRVLVARLAGLCLLMFAVMGASAQSDSETVAAAPILRVAYLEFPPITYQDSNGQPAGSFIELTRKVAVEAGYQPEFIYLPVSRVYLYLINGLIDVWPGVTEVPVLQGNVLESWISPAPVHLSAWYLESSPPLIHLEELRGKRVIVIGGYTYAGLLDWLAAHPDIRITEAPNHRSAVDMLKRRRGDYLLDYRQPVRQVLVPGSDDMLRESEVRTRDLAWIFSLAHPRAALMRDEFDDAYLRLVERGEVPPVRDLTGAYVIPGYPGELQ
ncbi:amino acid ABC transporter substrate-binding protein, PAAT family (TC 3.A.1.3.-) [Marinobacter gudaonensis]|uniref:Amino acid ABC transporter substrate-binding protein, PAAT family (TC 3.A.1.3.-) n=1 Tax=Marinobacter gudaonensis TaxID=375760 RepID=A0A1I6H1P2_9GAMM|nr:transporter substrate-binding domain-containing protein [Marinobacter gudaonensis]SFR48354.1 amino acid ABC transporter substrate-binding protein, PAAT family (TC 3.A.1.3.-) [Marinobacter gudaonensis]